MKLTRLSEAVNTRRQLSEADQLLSETDQIDKAHLLLQALDELGIKQKWRVQKFRVTDDIVGRTIGIMNNKRKSGHTGDMMWPLLKISDGLGTLKGASCQEGLSSLISGLEQIRAAGGFLASDQLSELMNAANLLVAQSTELFVYTELLANTMAAILLVLKKTTSEDVYEKAIATATLKKLGLKD